MTNIINFKAHREMRRAEKARALGEDCLALALCSLCLAAAWFWLAMARAFSEEGERW